MSFGAELYHVMGSLIMKKQVQDMNSGISVYRGVSIQSNQHNRVQRSYPNTFYEFSTLSITGFGGGIQHTILDVSKFRFRPSGESLVNMIGAAE